MSHPVDPPDPPDPPNPPDAPEPSASPPPAPPPRRDAEQGWSTPALYSGSTRVVAPRMYTEADPMGAVLTDDWGPDSHRQAVWSTPTYVGRRRLRPGTTPAARTIDAARGRPNAASAASAAEDTGAGTAEGAGDAAGSADAQPLERANRRLMADSRTMAIASLASRLTGFLRSILLVAALGSTTKVSVSYNSGNNFPNMVYELLLGGVLSSVLIPLLVHAQAQDDDDGLAYTQRLLSIATAALGVLTLVAVACAPLIAGAFAPPDQRSLTSLFATLLLPEIFFYGLGAMFMAVLNIKNVYGPGAWAPVLNNVIMIVTVGVFWALPGPKTLTPTSITTPQILVMGIGTTLGIAAQALVLIPSLRRVGFRWHWRFRALPHEVGRLREMGTLAGWVLGYVVASQVGVTVIQRIGSYNGGFTVFTYADLLFQMPYGILVVSLLTAIMPRMSRAAVRNDHAAVIADLSLGTRLSVVALVPITAGLIVLGPDLGITLFAHVSSTLAGGRLIGSSLAWSAFGLVFFAIVMLQLRVFYAMRDARTPTLINVCMVATKVVLVLTTNRLFRAADGVDVNEHPSARAVEWLNISTSASYVVGAIVGYVLLTRRLGGLGLRPVVATTVRMVGVSALGGVAAYLVVLAARNGFGHGHSGALVGLIGGGLVGLAVLIAVGWLARIPEIHDFRSLLRP